MTRKPVKSPAVKSPPMTFFIGDRLDRPPSWPLSSEVPQKGAWCTCCSRHPKNTGRGKWWRNADDADLKGWCCINCHPPDHLRADQIVIVET